MERFTPYLGVVVAFLVGTLAVAFSGSASVERFLTIHTLVASSTLSVVPSITLPSLTLPNISPKSDATTSPAPTEVIPIPKKTLSVPATVVVPTLATIPSSGDTRLDASAVSLRQALVNIICYAPADSVLLRSITGSGVTVDPKGIILTNAHIAQYFLLADRGVSCTIRTGSPAVNAYRASLMYISPAWLRTNANVLTETTPSGTGQYDFAFLAVTSSATSAVLPAYFPSVRLATESPDIGTPVSIASYGAQYLKLAQIQSKLFPIVVFDSIRDVFTFDTNTVDVVALSGSQAAQEGSSGGGVVDSAGKLIGTLTTTKKNSPANTNILHAITVPYIRAEYENETGHSLDSLLSQPPLTAVSNFAPRIPTFESIITAHLP